MNTILIMLDSLRPDHMGCYGNKWIKTPNLDALAQESMIFDRAVPESLPTLEVRRAMFTGMRLFPFDKEFFPDAKDFFPTGADASHPSTGFLGIPQGNQPGWAPIPWDQATLAEMLQGWRLAGFLQVGLGATGVVKYRTALISDTAPYFATPGMNYQRGFAHYDFIRGHEIDAYGVPALSEDVDLNRYAPEWYQKTFWAKMLKHYLANTAKWQVEEDHFAPRTFKAAIQWLEDSREATDPFFLCVDEWDPHEPFDPLQEYVDLYDPGYKGVEMIEPFYGPTEKMTDAELNHMRALYAGKVTMVDKWFGRFMEKVTELGLLENTIIIVTSDHGHLLGEHGVSGKLPAGMYNELVNCVLLIRHPQGIGAGQRSDALVQHQDICTTVLDFMGVRPPYELDGQNLMPILKGEKARVRDYATCGMMLNVWCRTDDHVLICRTTGDEPQLFDMNNDPDQQLNIAADRPEIVKRLYDLILADAKGGPIAPGWEIDTRFEGTRWMDWSPFREFT
ncbi:sulfatase [Chloroflexota bacterium]